MNVQQDTEAGKTIAILSYITLIGWIVALVMHNNSNPKSGFAAFHLRQGLGLLICMLAVIITVIFVSFIIPFFFIAIPFINIGVVVLVILQIIQAINGKKQGLPFIGAFIDKTFSGIN